MGKLIGIDLGTTNSVVAVMEGGEPTIISTAEGERLCPSVVAFGKLGERRMGTSALIGRLAKRQAVVNPENTVFSIKRLMGRRVDDPEVDRARRLLSYRIVGGPSGDVRVHIPQTGQTYTPQEISALILRKLKEDAETYLGETVTQAVITVPAYFNDSQRQATKDAGQIAGLEVLRIVNEPTAASLAYGLDKRSPETIMVFDLGGGTFDVSILDVGDGVVEVRATSGNTFLGGDDWDRRIVDTLVADLQREQGIDLSQDRQALQRLQEAAEKARIELSSVSETEINLPFIAADIAWPQAPTDQADAGQAGGVDVGSGTALCGARAAGAAGCRLTAEQLDEVILVGGATRMPMIQDLVCKLTQGKEPNRSVNPDEVVALGAAVQAGILTGEVKDVLLLDVTPLTLGIETLGGVMTPVIERNTAIPMRKSEIFSTAEDGQTAVTIHVLEGERPMAGDNMSLGQFNLEGIPAAPRGTPQIEVTFDIDANGILDVSARDKASGVGQAMRVIASTHLSKGDLQRMIQETRQRGRVSTPEGEYTRG